MGEGGYSRPEAANEGGRAMNKTRIEWADFSWNSIIGCRNACGVTADNPTGWCYAQRLATTRLAHLCPQCGTFEPHLHPERLDQPLHVKKPALIFADSMSDWWSEGVYQEWLDKAIWGMSLARWHRFAVLTKRPDRINDWTLTQWPHTAWLGVSITSGDDWWRWEALAKLPARIHKFISVEPLLGFGVGREIADTINRPEWCIVGPRSGPGAKQPWGVWQKTIRNACLNHPIGLTPIPLFEKPGLPLTPAIRQMPLDLAQVYRKGGLDD